MRETREKMAKEQERKLQELLEAQKTGRNSDVVLKGMCLLLKFLYLASDAKSVVSTSEGASSACAC